MGAIEYLIENGRQLELFREGGVGAPVRGLETDDTNQEDNAPSDPPEELLPF